MSKETANLHIDKLDIKSIRKFQVNEVNRLKTHMANFLLQKRPNTIISVGEGVVWTGTFIGWCLKRNYVPKSVGKIIIVDIMNHSSNSFFTNSSNQFVKNFLILPILSDATRLSLKNDTSDVTISSLMIDDCNDHSRLLYELLRCTRSQCYLMISGHGIDTYTKYNRVAGLLGASHNYQCLPEQFDDLLKSFKVYSVYKWQNSHTWLRIIKKY